MNYVLSFSQWMETWLPNAWKLRDDFIEASWETLFMLGLSTLVGGFFGLILGIIMTVTGPGGILENRWLYNLLDGLVNIMRSIPFIIMLALLINVTRGLWVQRLGQQRPVYRLFFDGTFLCSSSGDRPIRS